MNDQNVSTFVKTEREALKFAQFGNQRSVTP